MNRFFYRLMLGVLIAAPALPAALSTAQAQDGVTLVIGRITDSPDKHYKRMAQMAEYLAAELVDYGVGGVDVMIYPTEEEMAEALRRGRVDIVSETPFLALELQEEGVVDILMREWKKGVPEYHSVIVVRKDSPAQSLADLAGRRVTFEDPGSTSGYLLPRAALEDAGLSLLEVANPNRPVPADRVGYRFSGSESKVVRAVAEGTADAGAYSNLDWDDEESTPPEVKAQLRILHETKPVIRSTLMVRRSIPADIKTRLAEVLEHMHESEDGRAAMKKYAKVAKYDRIEGEALRGLEEARRIWLRVRGRQS